MKTIRFTKHVLGEETTEQLKAKRVTQTLRGPRSDIVQHYGARDFGEFGERISVALMAWPWKIDEDRVIGYARLVSIEQINWLNLDLDDAIRGGFNTGAKLESALKRAGYRFKELEDYDFYRIRFKWE